MGGLTTSQGLLPVLSACRLSRSDCTVRHVCLVGVSANRSKHCADMIGLVSKGQSHHMLKQPCTVVVMGRTYSRFSDKNKWHSICLRILPNDFSYFPFYGDNLLVLDTIYHVLPGALKFQFTGIIPSVHPSEIEIRVVSVHIHSTSCQSCEKGRNTMTERGGYWASLA